jgi:tight adherence protein C
MPDNTTITWAAFLMGSTFILMVYLVFGGRRNRLETRIDDLATRGQGRSDPDPVAEFARAALPRMGAPLMPKDLEERTRLQTRLLHAGLYGRQAMAFFLGVKMSLTVTPAALGLLAGLAGLVALQNGLIFGALLSIIGLIGPSFWLDRRKAKRQIQLRRALPDALDLLVICLEGGLSLPGAIRRVASELRLAHPVLAAELAIVQRETQLGRSTGEALQRFADRSDLEEVRSLAAVIAQAERYGASLAKALRVHAEALRTKRMQRAEEMAQKAVIKLLVPTILFIFPGIFLVVLGPAIIQILALFDRLRH